MSTRLKVNGTEVEVSADADTPLLTVLREELGLVGSRFGCGLGLCGACVVNLDGNPVSSCETPLWQAEGGTVVTVEGLGTPDRPHPVQAALLERQAVQCGYCISGIIVRAAALLGVDPHPDEATVTEALEPHLCRCGSHGRIVDAIVSVGEEPT